MYEGQLAAWLVTLAVEAIVAAILARQFGLVSWKAAAAAFFGSLVTHPVVWWTYFKIIYAIGYWPTFAVVEGFAVGVSKRCQRHLAMRKPCRHGLAHPPGASALAHWPRSK